MFSSSFGPSARPLRMAVLTRYEELGASSRVRALQYLPYLKQEGIEATVFPLFSNRYLERMYEGKRPFREAMAAYVRRCLQLRSVEGFDLIWLEKEVFPMLPYVIDRVLLKKTPVVLDIDDAVFHNYDLSPRRWVRALLGDKIDRLMANSALVTAGNGYLADRAKRAGAPWVEVLPSPVPLARYTGPARCGIATRTADRFRIAWIGSPATALYLEPLKGAFQQLSRSHDIEFRVIGAASPNWEGVNCVSIPWSETTEVELLKECDLGIMPLRDSPWEKGKCSFKLIQYMACGLPVIASPIGMNRDVVDQGRTGLFATTEFEWLAALQFMIEHPAEAAQMGALGRSEIEARFNTESQARQLARWLRIAAGGQPTESAAISGPPTRG